MLEKIVKSIMAALSNATVMTIISDLIAGKAAKDVITADKSIDLVVSILRSEATRDLAAKSPEKVLSTIVLLAPVLDELQSIAADAKAAKSVNTQAVS